MSAPQEEDRLPGRAIAKILIAGAIVMAIAIVAARLLLAGHERTADAAAPLPPASAPLVTPKRVELDRYEWIDRDAGLARIPIDRAMDLVADGGAP